MAVREGYKHADTPHAKTVMAPGWTYGCHSSKVGDRPRGGPATYRVQVHFDPLWAWRVWLAWWGVR